MNKPNALWMIVFSLLVLPVVAFAQTSTLVSPTNLLPASYRLDGFSYIPQSWNNCGPATLTMGLTFFGYPNDQHTPAQWLKPNYEDKNVSPWQMADYINTELPGTTRAMVRYGGTLERLKTLLANDFVILIEAGYDPPPHDLGWMGHYLLIKGYDDTTQEIITNDSYDGESLAYSYEHIEEFWMHFNHVYLVLYDIDREQALLALLGDDADPTLNAQNALALARQHATADPTNPFAWFNMGTNFTLLQMYPEAAASYDQARTHGLPWRMLWYQFGPFEAYNALGRYNDTIALAQANLSDGGGQYVEETFYYAGVAREGMGETQRALDNYNEALLFNPNFEPARIARDALLANNG